MLRLAFKLNSIVDLVFPVLCKGCGRPGRNLCATCRKPRLKIKLEQECHVCRLPITSQLVHRECVEYTNLSGVWVACVYTNVLKNWIHAIKYQFNSQAIQELSEIMYKVLSPNLTLTGVLMTSVPISPRRYRWRGYNQAELLARDLALRWGFAYTELLARNADRGYQVGRNKLERAQNWRGNLKVLDVHVLSQFPRLIIVDDVMTTGSTLEACASALRQAGYTGEIYGMVAAR